MRRANGLVGQRVVVGVRRHRWGDKQRDVHHTDEVCRLCGVLKRGFCEPPEYWTEFYRDGAKLDGRPECVEREKPRLKTQGVP